MLVFQFHPYLEVSAELLSRGVSAALLSGGLSAAPFSRGGGGGVTAALLALLGKWKARMLLFIHQLQEILGM